MKNKNTKSSSKRLSAVKNNPVVKNESGDNTNSDRNEVENLPPCKLECLDIEGSDVECIEDRKGSERLLDYIILDDDDNDESKPSIEQPLSVRNAELQLKCEIGDVKIKEEFLCSVTESISSTNGNHTESENVKVQSLADETANEKSIDAVDVATPKEEGGGEKNCDSLVLTLDEKELGEISETVESKNGNNESHPVIPKEPSAELNEKHVAMKKFNLVDKPQAAETTENIPGVSSSENETKSSDITDKRTESNDILQIKTENNQKVKSNSVELIPKSRVVWVSNLKRSTKATDLKQHLNKFGKVITTKIVTDGRRCFGYVVLESCKDAANCINNLNDSEYEGVKIAIATSKPIVENKNKLKEDEKLNENNKNNKKYTHVKDRKEKSKSKTIPKFAKRRRSPSTDPLTTKFDDRNSSRIKNDRIEKEYLREKQEKERLKRRLAEEMKRSRDELNRLREKEEKQRQMELKLELERKKLRLEKEMLERERREMIQLEEEKRKIEKEKLSLMRQKLEMEKSIRDSKRKVTPEKEERKVKKQRIPVSNFNFDKFDIERRRRSSEQKDDSRYSDIRKSKEKKQTTSFYRDTMSKTTRHDKNIKHQSRRDEKDFLCIPPSPPKLSNDFEIPKRKQLNDSVRSYNKKSCCSPSSSKQNYQSYRKSNYDKLKILPPARKDERTNVGKSSNHYGHSGKDQRMTWNSAVSSQWKMDGMGSQSGTGFPVNRYSEINYSGINCNTSRFPQPTFYNPQPINLPPPPDYKYYFYHHPSNRKY